MDKDLPQDESKLGIGPNPVDLDEAKSFTLEAELVRLSRLVKKKRQSRADQTATNNQIKKLMKQGEEDKERLSRRGRAAFDYLNSTKEKWDVS